MELHFWVVWPRIGTFGTGTAGSIPSHPGSEPQGQAEIQRSKLDDIKQKEPNLGRQLLSTG